MKIDIHQVTQGVSKYRVPKRLEHLRTSKDQSDGGLMKYYVSDKVEPFIITFGGGKG